MPRKLWLLCFKGERGAFCTIIGEVTLNKNKICPLNSSQESQIESLGSHYSALFNLVKISHSKALKIQTNFMFAEKNFATGNWVNQGDRERDSYGSRGISDCHFLGQVACSANLQKMPVCGLRQCPGPAIYQGWEFKNIPRHCLLKQVKIIALPSGFNWAHIHQFLPGVSWSLEKHAKIKGGSFLFFKLAGLVLKKKKQTRISIPALMDYKMIGRWARAEMGGKGKQKRKYIYIFENLQEIGLAGQ